MHISVTLQLHVLDTDSVLHVVGVTVIPVMSVIDVNIAVTQRVTVMEMGDVA